MMTALLIAQLAGEYPGTDLVREVRAWRGYVTEQGQPRDWEAALRGWMEKAKVRQAVKGQVTAIPSSCGGSRGHPADSMTG
jgi:hypothetical protein